MRAADIIANSNGLVTVRELRRSGVDSRWIRRQIVSGHWSEPLPGVVDTTGEPATMAKRITAAWLAAGPDAFLVGRTAAAVRALMPTHDVTGRIELGVPHGHHRIALPGIVVSQFRKVPELEVIAGVPITNCGATLATLARDLSLNELRLVSAEAVHRGLVTIDEIQAAAGSSMRGIPALRMVIEELWAGAASGGEAAYWRGIKDSGLPLPELNVLVPTDDGDKVVDALWRRYALVAEVDGRSVHDGAKAFVDDRRRQNALQARGLVVMTFPVSDILTNLDRVLGVTEDFLRMRALDLGLPWPPPKRSR